MRYSWNIFDFHWNSFSFEKVWTSMCVVSISHSLYIFFCRTSLPLRGVIINSRPITCVLSYLKPFLPWFDLYRPPGFSSHIIITLCTMDLFTCNNIILWWWFKFYNMFLGTLHNNLFSSYQNGFYIGHIICQLENLCTFILCRHWRVM